MAENSDTLDVAADAPLTDACVSGAFYDPDYLSCLVNTLFDDNPALGFLLGILVSVLAALSRWVLNWLADRKRPLSGTWLLCIFDDNGNAEKMDKYKIRHAKYAVAGKIKRLYPLKKRAEKVRRYTFKGYSEGSNLVYAFWPTRQGVASFGTCTLKLKDDDYYEGIYTRPFDSDIKADKPITATICLTRSSSRIIELTEKLEAKSQKKVRHALLGLFFRFRREG